MSPAATQLLYTAETASLYSLATLGLYLAFRVLRFPDFTAEGGFGLSALVGGMIMVTTGSPWLGLASAVAVGMLAGATTALLANVVKLPTILSSILTMTMCFSVGLLAAGKPSINLPDAWVLGSLHAFAGSSVAAGLIGGVGALLLIAFALLLLLRTGTGLLLRVRGENPHLLKDMKHSLVVWDVFGLAIANGIVGLAAVLLSQRAGYANISMGRGVAIAAIAAIMLGEAILRPRRPSTAFAACLVGTLILQLVRLLALNLGIPDGGLDLVTSLLVIGFCWSLSRSPQHREALLERIRM
jgi:putative ABC transport system permease protein